MHPQLIAEPFPYLITNILKKFEDGKPLSTEELHFLLSKEGTFRNHMVDNVIKYYLKTHAHIPEKTLAFTIPKEKLNHNNMQALYQVVNNLLKHHVSHVDLNMSMEQYLQFKAVGLKELIFWHGPQCLFNRTSSPSIPKKLYLQWGHLFCIIHLDSLANGFVLDGNVLVYFENMKNRNLNQCILDYAKHHKISHQLDVEDSLVLTPKEELTQSQQSIFLTPTLTPYKKVLQEE